MILFRMTTATFSGRQHSAALCTIYTHTLICTPSYKNRPMYVQLVYRLTSQNVLSPCTHKETSCTSRAYTTITGRCRRTRINSNESKQNRNNKHSTKEHIWMAQNTEAAISMAAYRQRTFGHRTSQNALASRSVTESGEQKIQRHHNLHYEQQYLTGNTFTTTVSSSTDTTVESHAVTFIEYMNRRSPFVGFTGCHRTSDILSTSSQYSNVKHLNQRRVPAAQVNDSHSIIENNRRVWK